MGFWRIVIDLVVFADAEPGHAAFRLGRFERILQLFAGCGLTDLCASEIRKTGEHIEIDLLQPRQSFGRRVRLQACGFADGQFSHSFRARVGIEKGGRDRFHGADEDCI